MEITVRYRLSTGEKISVNVTPEVSDELRESAKKEKTQLRYDRRYRSTKDYVEGITESVSSCYVEDVAEIYERMEEYRQLHAALERLDEVQKQRIIAYYLEGFTVEEIAEKECVSHQSVSESLRLAISNLRNIL